MFNRCLRKDQWDWEAVFNAFGNPSVWEMRTTVFYIDEIGRALRRQDMEEAMNYLQAITSTDFPVTFEFGLRRIYEEIPRLNNSVVAPIQQGERIEKPAKLTNRDTDPYIVSQAALKKTEEANASHQQTLQILVRFLESKGFLVELNRLIDAYCRLKTGPAIFEIKSLTKENEREQCRSALSQLYEYRFLHDMPQATLWSVFSRPIEIGWMTEYFLDDRNIKVLWVEDGELTGPSFGELMASWLTL